MQLRSSNPALKRAMRSPRPGYGQAYQMPYGQGGTYQSPYGQPGYQQGYYQQQGYPGYPQPGQPYGAPMAPSDRMTIDDVVMRTGMTLGMVVLAGVVNFFVTGVNPGIGMVLTFGGLIGGLILGLVIAFKQSTNPALILTYALLEGLLVGGISQIFEMSAGVAAGTLVTQAVVGTMLAFGTMLALYKSRVIRVTNTFIKVVMGALIAALVLVVANLLIGMFVSGGLGLREPTWLGVGFGALMIVLACAVLAIDFKGIEDGLAMGVPQQMAWHFAFGLTVTLVWLYIEILRLLWMLYAIFSE